MVITKNKTTHQLEIQFKSPFVGDIFEWNVKGKPKKGYWIIDGKDTLSIDMSSVNKRIKQKNGSECNRYLYGSSGVIYHSKQSPLPWSSLGIG